MQKIKKNSVFKLSLISMLKKIKKTILFSEKIGVKLKSAKKL